MGEVGIFTRMERLARVLDQAGTRGIKRREQ